MHVDGVLADTEVARDHLVRMSERKCVENFAFMRAQFRGLGNLDAAVDPGNPFHRSFDRADQRVIVVGLRGQIEEAQGT
jgi:hypothetical protein